MNLLLQRHRGDVASFIRLMKMSVTNVPKQVVTLSLVALGLIFSSTTNAQSSPADCKLGCTSNDVQIKAAYLSDAGGNKLSGSFVCPQTGIAKVYLTLELTTKTPRIGLSLIHI